MVAHRTLHRVSLIPVLGPQVFQIGHSWGKFVVATGVVARERLPLRALGARTADHIVAVSLSHLVQLGGDALAAELLVHHHGVAHRYAVLVNPERHGADRFVVDVLGVALAGAALEVELVHDHLGLVVEDCALHLLGILQRVGQRCTDGCPRRCRGLRVGGVLRAQGTRPAAWSLGHDGCASVVHQAQHGG